MVYLKLFLLGFGYYKLYDFLMLQKFKLWVKQERKKKEG